MGGGDLPATEIYFENSHLLTKNLLNSVLPLFPQACKRELKLSTNEKQAKNNNKNEPKKLTYSLRSLIQAISPSGSRSGCSSSMALSGGRSRSGTGPLGSSFDLPYDEAGDDGGGGDGGWSPWKRCSPRPAWPSAGSRSHPRVRWASIASSCSQGRYSPASGTGVAAMAAEKIC